MTNCTCTLADSLILNPTGIFVLQRSIALLFFSGMHYLGRKMYDEELQTFGSIGKLGVLVSFLLYPWN